MTAPAVPEEGRHQAAEGQAGAPAAPLYPTADRAARREFRPRRTISASLAALALVGIGFVAAVEIVTALTSRPAHWLPRDPVMSWAQTTQWDDRAVLVGAGVLVLAGLVLLALALRGGHPRTVPVRTGDPDLVIGLRPKGFATALAHAAEDVPGVHAARATVRRGRVNVVAHASGWDDARLSEAVRHAVTERIEALAPIADYRVSVSMKERR
ncbi:DUF6286 domain-containing protein [Nonomuraea sp. NPDC059194]|uniref:DUF6286 domain-containing protein n=1 Tax=Nonomuraea sp. NPDC059194 TaxID=3346764 RepID=UPI00369FA6D0